MTVADLADRQCALNDARKLLETQRNLLLVGLASLEDLAACIEREDFWDQARTFDRNVIAGIMRREK